MLQNVLHYTFDYDLSLDSPARFVREEVFMKEQGFENEFDLQDHDSYHFVFYDKNNHIVGTTRLFHTKDKPGYMTIGRVAILANQRDKKYGKEMMRIVEKEAKKLNAKTLELSAQCRVQGFYEKCGFTPIGDIYMDEHCPHIHMKKKID